MFSAQDEKQIIQLNRQLSGDVTIGFYDPGHETTRAFKRFCDRLGRLAPRIRIAEENGTPGEIPHIRIGRNLRYQALPYGHELPPFLEILKALDTGLLKIPEPYNTRLQKNKLPAALRVFIAPACTFCPAVVRQLLPLSMVDVQLQVTIIDSTLFQEIALERGVQAVPTVLLDDRFRWTGSVPLEEIIEVIATRDPLSLGASSLEQILKDGDAAKITAMMLAADRIIPAFYDLLTHPKWPVRLGAMVAAEALADQNPDLAAEMLAPLWHRFPAAPDPIKGDILYIFGEIGSALAIPWLQKVLNGSFDREIEEAAQEALEKLSRIGVGG